MEWGVREVKVTVGGTTYNSAKEAILVWLAKSPQNVDTFIAQVLYKLEGKE